MYCVRNITEDLYWVGANDTGSIYLKISIRSHMA